MTKKKEGSHAKISYRIITFFDTAEVYNSFINEEFLGNFSLLN
jgi:diketogulonate reductase-like aldo/keto reductase